MSSLRCNGDPGMVVLVTGRDSDLPGPVGGEVIPFLGEMITPHGSMTWLPLRVLMQ